MDDRAADRPLLNTRDQVLYGRLMRGFPGHLVLAHVSLPRILSVDAKDAARHAVADFVLCRSDFTPLAVFELADGSRQPHDPAGMNLRRDQLLRAAGIKVIRLSAEDIPREPALKALVAALPAELPPRHMRCAS